MKVIDIVCSYASTRKDAVKLGIKLSEVILIACVESCVKLRVQAGMIYHTSGEHSFADKCVLYLREDADVTYFVGFISIVLIRYWLH